MQLSLKRAHVSSSSRRSSNSGIGIAAAAAPLPQRCVANAASHAERQHRRTATASVRRARVIVAHASASGAAAAPTGAAAGAVERLRGLEVIRCHDGARADIPSLVGGGRAVVVWARSFGCPFCQELSIQLNRDVLPQLEAQGAKLFLVAIGTLERSADFVAATGFPADRLLADPEGATYAALGLVKGVRATFFDIGTPLSLARRALRPGGMDDLRERVLPTWQPWQPPKGFEQALQQGGVLVFDGPRVAFMHKDRATGAHADMAEVVATVTRLAAASEAGAAACSAAAAAGTSDA